MKFPDSPIVYVFIDMSDIRSNQNNVKSFNITYSSICENDSQFQIFRRILLSLLFFFI